MKIFILLLALLAFSFCVDPELEKCIQAKCPDQYAKCKAAKGCEDKLNKCEGKCGAKVDYTCWALCIGLPGAAANVANCAVNQGCLAKSSTSEIIKNLMSYVDGYIHKV